MTMIQPFHYEFCTAFRERKQIADKTNEIVAILNDEISPSIDELTLSQSELREDINDLNVKVNPSWIKVEDSNDIYIDNILQNDLKIEINILYYFKFPDISSSVLSEFDRQTIYLKKDSLIKPTMVIIPTINDFQTDINKTYYKTVIHKITLSYLAYMLNHSEQREISNLAVIRLSEDDSVEYFRSNTEITLNYDGNDYQNVSFINIYKAV